MSGSRAFAPRTVGTSSGTVAAGNDTRFASTPSTPADRGYLAWTQPPYALVAGTALPTSGQLNLVRIRRVPAGNVTNIVTYVTAAGSSLTSGQCFVALYTAAGVLVGQSADQSTTWAAGSGLKTAALTGGPYTVTAGDYYVGAWFNGTTGPSIIRSGTVNANLTNAGLSAPNFDVASANGSITTTAPNPFGTQTTLVYQWWFALS